MTPDRPNILWYCTDQQRFDTIGALGNPHVRTPNLDRFVAQSVAFTHAYCQSPICTPSRASFLTGMYPSRVHNARNGNATVPPETADHLVTRALAEAGYDGGLVGKLHLAGAATAQEPRVDDGYRVFEYSHAPRNDWPLAQHDYARWLREKGHDPAEVLLSVTAGYGGLMAPTPEHDNVPPELHQTTWCTERAIAFITDERPGDTPWFLSVNPYDPHPPYNPPLGVLPPLRPVGAARPAVPPERSRDPRPADPRGRRLPKRVAASRRLPRDARSRPPTTP